MTIYIDTDYKCHVTDDGTLRAVDTDFFVGKCKAFIEGYRYIPPNETWTRGDGAVFHGEMLAPFADYSTLEAFQALDYAHMRDLSDLVDIIYSSDLDLIN